jgi:hypothetical protein
LLSCGCTGPAVLPPDTPAMIDRPVGSAMALEAVLIRYSLRETPRPPNFPTVE